MILLFPIVLELILLESMMTKENQKEEVMKPLFIAIIFLLSFNLFAQFGGGDGDGFRPYVIATPEHLNNIRLQDDDGNYLYLDCYFEVIGNVDLSAPEWSDGEGWEPIGTPEHPFTGNFYCNRGKIENLTINRPTEDYVGLFGYVREACFYNIILENANVVGRDYVGSLVGYSLASSYNIKGIGPVWPWHPRCSVTGSINGNNYTGGLIGFSTYSELRKCCSFGTVSGANFVGGLCGFNELGTYTEPENFYGDTWVYTPGKISGSYSTEDVDGSEDMIGDLLGKNSAAEISGCNSTSDVITEGVFIGGLVGLNTDTGKIIDCYTYDATISGEGSIGGLVGSNLGSTITNCYTKTNVFGTDTYIEGLVGRNTGTITNSYWDMDVSGFVEPGNGEGRTTDDMTFPYSEDTYVDWDFEYIWREDEDMGSGYYKDGYPYLKWEHFIILHDFAGGSGTEEDPYLIATTYQLNSVREELNSHFLQIRDLNLDEYPFNEGEGWEPIGSAGKEFTGYYDGNGFEIQHLYINLPESDNVGLFGRTINAEMTNITLANSNITGNYNVGGIVGDCNNSTVSNCKFNGTLTGNNNNVGGLVGYLVSSTVNNCSVSGIISGYTYVGGAIGQQESSEINYSFSSGSVSGQDRYVGGLIGIISQNSTTSKCYSTCNVETPGGQHIGGFAGGTWQEATISDCYAKGSVTTNSTYTGGFIGSTNAVDVITNCYSIGEVTANGTSSGFEGQGTGTINVSFWNTETSGNSGSAGTVSGRTTAEMTFPYASNTYSGWDFAAIWIEDTDGTVNQGYPYLSGIEYVSTEYADPLPGDILINEVCSDGFRHGIDNDGFIELLNVRNYSLSLDNVEIRYYDNNAVDPAVLALHGVVEANDYIIICQDFTVYNVTYGNPPADFEAPKSGDTSLFPLDGGEDIIEVYVNSKAGTVDAFNDKNSPWSWDGSKSLERLSTGSGGNQANWAEGDGTPRSDDSPLPVILSSFTVALQNNFPLLYWRTESEQNNFGWNVYRGENESAISDNSIIRLNSSIIEGASTTNSPTEYTFTDNYNLENNKSYWYWLESIGLDGSSTFYNSISIVYSNNDDDDSPQIPIIYGLQQNYPNPFNPTTTIKFAMDADVQVQLTVYNIKGQVVKNLFDDEVTKDRYIIVIWNGTNNRNKKVANGIYFYRLKSEREIQIHKMILLK